jgi:hypothetical protein
MDYRSKVRIYLKDGRQITYAIRLICEIVGAIFLGIVGGLIAAAILDALIGTVPCPVCNQRIRRGTTPCPHCQTTLRWS